MPRSSTPGAARHGGTDQPAYDPDIYWRGRVWLDQFYFGVKGWRTTAIAAMPNSSSTSCLPMPRAGGQRPHPRELQPGDRRHAGASNFSWSSAHLYMLYRNFLKTEG